MEAVAAPRGCAVALRRCCCCCCSLLEFAALELIGGGLVNTGSASEVSAVSRQAFEASFVCRDLTRKMTLTMGD